MEVTGDGVCAATRDDGAFCWGCYGCSTAERCQMECPDEPLQVWDQKVTAVTPTAMVSEFGDVKVWRDGVGWENALPGFSVKAIAPINFGGHIVLTREGDVLAVDDHFAVVARLQGRFDYRELVQSGDDGFCGLTPDQRVECVERVAPEYVPSDIGLSHVDALTPYACALSSREGRVDCWSHRGSVVERSYGPERRDPVSLVAEGATDIFEVGSFGVCVARDRGRTVCDSRLQCTALEKLVGDVDWIGRTPTCM